MSANVLQPKTRELADLQCRVCHTHQPGVRLGHKMDYDLISCVICGSVSIAPFPTPEVLTQAIADNKYMVTPPVLKIKKFMRALTEAKKYAKGKKFVHVQSYTGEFVNAAKTEGAMDAKGTEADVTTCENAQKAYGKALFENISFYPFTERGDKFDIVHVQEGLELALDPDYFIQSLGNLLDKGGVLSLSTLDGNHFSLPGRIVKWREVLPPARVIYYSKEGITKLLERNGFKVKKIFFNFGPVLDVVAVKG